MREQESLKEGQEGLEGDKILVFVVAAAMKLTFLKSFQSVKENVCLARFSKCYKPSFLSLGISSLAISSIEVISFWCESFATFI